MRCTCLVFLYQDEIKTGNARYDGANISLCFIYTGTEGLDDDGYPWCALLSPCRLHAHCIPHVKGLSSDQRGCALMSEAWPCAA